jgi:hypothetical protein
MNLLEHPYHNTMLPRPSCRSRRSCSDRRSESFAGFPAMCTCAIAQSPAIAGGGTSDDTRRDKKIRREVDAPLFFSPRRFGRSAASSCFTFMPNESVSQWPRSLYKACARAHHAWGMRAYGSVLLLFFPSNGTAEGGGRGRKKGS